MLHKCIVHHKFMQFYAQKIKSMRQYETVCLIKNEISTSNFVKNYLAIFLNNLF